MNLMIDGNLSLVPFGRRFLESCKTKGVISKYHSWFIDPEVTKHNSHGLFPMSPKEYDSFFEDIENNKILVGAILIEEAGKPLIHIGNVSLQSIDWINRSAEIAIVIGEKEYWGKGYGYRACRLMMRHGFRNLNLHRIWTGTAQTNEGMRKIAEKLLMSVEGRFVDGMFLEGRYVDIFEYAVLESTFEQL